MEHRFTLKDFVIVALLIGVMTLVILSMFQYDRQWKKLVALESRTSELARSAADQSRQVEAIRRTLATGVPTPTTRAGDAPTTRSANAFASPKGAPFEAQLAAMARPDYSQGDWLIQNFGVKVAQLTPLLSSDTYASIVQNRVIEPLAYRDPESLEWVPQLATDWKVSADGLTIDATLRRGVKFSDGAPMSADDFLFAVDFIRNPEVNAPRARSALEPLDRLEKVGDYALRFTFKRPYFEALSLALGSSPMHKAFYSHYTPKQFNESVGLLIGTGPYRMPDPTAWRPGTPIQLVRNEAYWGPPGPFDKLYWREVEEDAAELTMFRNGEIDIFGAQPDQFDELKNDPVIKARNNQFQYYFRDGGYGYVAWNEKKKGQPTIFTDKRVRQAMTMLIDRERIARDIYRGYAKPAVGPFGVASKQNDPEIKAWPYDVKRAQELLAAAGFSKRNPQGVLIDDAGREFRFKLTYNNKNPLTERMILLIKDSLTRVGIVLEQEPTDWPIMIQKMNQRDFDAITLGWTGGVETDIYQMFHSSQIADGGDNFMSYSSPALDAAIEEARKTVDEAPRLAVWRKAHQIIHEDQPYTFLLTAQALVFVDKRIQNVGPTRSGLNYFGQDPMPIPWYVPADRQRHTN